MNATSLMLRDANYIAELIVERENPIVSQDRANQIERIIMRLLHRNGVSFYAWAVNISQNIDAANLDFASPRVVDLVQALTYNLIRRSRGITDENNKIIEQKESEGAKK